MKEALLSDRCQDTMDVVWSARENIMKDTSANEMRAVGSGTKILEIRSFNSSLKKLREKQGKKGTVDKCNSHSEYGEKE